MGRRRYEGFGRVGRPDGQFDIKHVGLGARIRQYNYDDLAGSLADPETSALAAWKQRSSRFSCKDAADITGDLVNRYSVQVVLPSLSAIPCAASAPSFHTSSLPPCHPSPFFHLFTLPKSPYRPFFFPSNTTTTAALASNHSGKFEASPLLRSCGTHEDAKSKFMPRTT